MANLEHLAILKRGVDEWYIWRRENPAVIPDLSGVDFQGVNLKGANLCGANLSSANLAKSNLMGAALSNADFSKANLSGADFSCAILFGINFSQANLLKANFTGADRSRVTFTKKQLRGIIIDHKPKGSQSRSGSVPVKVILSIESKSYIGKNPVKIDLECPSFLYQLL